MRYLLVLAVFAAQPLAAQEAFEITVYPYATAHRGEWEFEGHLNYANRGTTAFDGAVAPRQGQVRFAGELTRGLTDHWEMSAYLLAAQVPTLGTRYAGWRLRSRFRAPEEWRLPVKMGLSIEYEAARPAFSESARTFELTAILERRFGGLQLLFDPTFERDLAGPEHEFGGTRSIRRQTCGSAMTCRCTLAWASERRWPGIDWCSRRRLRCRWVARPSSDSSRPTPHRIARCSAGTASR